MKNESKSKELLLKEIAELKAQLRQNKKELSDTQQSLIAAVNSLDDMLFYKDSNSVYLGCNEGVLKFLNLKRNDVVGKTDFDLFPKHIAERHREDDKKILNTGIEIRYENWLTNANGQKILIEVHKSPMKDKKGKIIGIIGISRNISSRYMDEEKLKILQFGIDKSQIGIFQIDENARIRYVNDYGCEQLGYSREELLKLSVMDIDAKFDFTSWKQNRERIKTGFSNTFETIHISKDGSQFPVEITVNYLDFDDKPISFSFVRNITEQKNAQVELNKSEKRFRTLVEQSTDGMILADLNGKIIEVNKRTCDSLGYSVKELLGMKIDKIDLHFKKPDQILGLLKTLKPGEPLIIESKHRRKNGTVFSVEVSLGLIELHGKNVIVGFARDISERHQAQRALLENEEHLRTTLNSIADAVISTDAEGLITGMNPMAEHLTEWSADQSKGQKLSKILIVIDSNTGKKISDPVQKVIDTGKKIEQVEDSVLISKNGHKYHVDQSIAPLINAEGKITGVVLVIRDITKEYQFLEALHKSQTNLEKAQEIANMGSWDLNLSTGYGFWSREMFRLFRRDPELGIPSFEEFLNYVHKDDRQKLRDANQRAIKKKQSFNAEIRTNPEDGDMRIINAQFECKLDKDKKSVMLYGTCLDVTEQKKTDQALKDSEARFRGLIEASPDAIFITDYASRMLYANTTFNKQTGYKAEDFQMTLKQNNFIHSDDTEKVAEFIKNFINSTAKYSDTIENRFIDRRGKTHWYSSRVAKINFEEHPALQFISRDITEEQKVRDALIKSEKGYRTLFETMTQGVVYQDSDGKIISANPAAQKILGLSHEQLMGRTSADHRWHSILEDGSNFPGQEHPAMQALKTGKPVKDVLMGIYIPERDEYRWILVSAMPEFRADGKKPYQVFTTFTDITEIKRAENLIKQNTALLQESQQVARLGHYVYDVLEGKWQSSPMLDKVFGIDENYDKSVKGWVNLIHPDFRKEMTAYLHDYVIKKGNRFDKEYKIVRQNDNKERWVHGNGRLEYDADGNVMHMIGTIQDIHDRKILEEQLIQSQKMEAIGQLAGGVAHDFNNMLTVINGYSEMLLYRDLHPEFRNLIQEILNASTKATRLTSQLLAFSRKQIIQPKILNLNQVITDQIKMLHRLLGEDVEVSTAFDPQLRPVKADIGQIEQIIMNISINARDAMPLGGKLIIATKNIEFNDDDLLIHPELKPALYTMLSITDTGVGMDEITRTRVFEPFYTTKGRDKGTGLGLATVYGIVKQNDGFIYVDSEIQKGSTFNVYLPSTDEKSKDETRSAVEDEKLKGTETILLVEDDEGVRIVTHSTLQKYGYTVIAATNGEEALRVYDEYNGKFDLVLTDVVMPLMSGRELADKLRGKNPSIKILYFSGYTDNSIVHHGVLDEGMEFIQKPYSHTELAKKVKLMLKI
jgi:two-component system cell cycle sensor histidine kinase/response regulator CckA